MAPSASSSQGAEALQWARHSFSKLTVLQLQRMNDEMPPKPLQAGCYRCERCKCTLFTTAEQVDPPPPNLEAAGSSRSYFFSAPAEDKAVKEGRTDFGFGLNRKEIVCGQCSMHLGFLDSDSGGAPLYSVLPLCLSLQPDPSLKLGASGGAGGGDGGSLPLLGLALAGVVVGVAVIYLVRSRNTTD